MKRAVVEEIKSRLTILDCIEQYIKVEKAGKNYRALCPFHSEKSPSFYISPERDSYYCFGCGKKGDIFSFVGEYEGLDFKSTLKQLAEKTNVPLTDTYIPQQNADSKKRLYDILEDATCFFEQALKKSTEATDYLKKRGVILDTMEKYRIGYAQPGWDNLRLYLEKKGYSAEDMEQAGLIKQGQYKSYDRFRNRIMFPFMDTTGRVIGFSGRTIDPDTAEAKYINSPESPLFIKNKVLYGLYQAKDAIRKTKNVIVVEGQMDVIMTAQSGIGQVVASSGTAFSGDSYDELGMITQLGIIKRFTDTIYLAFDNDRAGIKAMYGATLQALTSGFTVYCIEIRGGKDMAELALSGKEQIAILVADAKEAILFFVTYLKSHTTDTVFYKSMSEKIWPLVAQMKSTIEQSHILSRIAEKINIPETTVHDDFKKYTIDKRSDTKQHTGEIKTLRTLTDTIFGLLFFLKDSHPKEYELYETKIKNIVGDAYDDMKEKAHTQKEALVFLIEKTYTDNEHIIKDSTFLIDAFEKDYYKQKLEKLKNEIKQDELLGLDTVEKLQEVALITKKISQT
jgi:DNA primase